MAPSLLPLPCVSPPNPLLLLFYLPERRPAGGRGPDLETREETTTKKKEGREVGQKTYETQLAPKKKECVCEVAPLCISLQVCVCVWVSRWAFNGTLSNASHAATAGWQ